MSSVVQIPRPAKSKARVSIEPVGELRIFSPKKWRVRLWEKFVMISVMVSCILGMFMVSFDSTPTVFWVLVYICDGIYLVDIGVQFFTAYVDNGILISDLRMIALRYITSTFFIDLLSIVPTDAIVTLVPSYLVWKTLTQLRLNRLLRFYRVLIYFGNLEDELGTNTAFIRSSKYAVISLMTTHALSCGWHAMACGGYHKGIARTCLNGSWADPSSGLGMESMSTKEAYIVSLYWAVATATSTGYGDISGGNLKERWFCIVCMLGGIGVFFGMLLGGMTSMLTNFDSQRARYIHRLKTVKDLMGEVKVADDLQGFVVGYYEFLWVRKHGEDGEGGMDVLPLPLKAEISLSVNRIILNKAPIFRNLGTGFLRMLSLHIHPVMFLPKQIIAKRGEVGNCMYYIHRGEVEVLSDEDDDTPIATLKKGKLFGEVSLVYNIPRTASIRASTHCDLMVLSKEELNEVLIHYPDEAHNLAVQAQKRCDFTDDTQNDAEFSEIDLTSKAFKKPTNSLSVPVEPKATRGRRKSFAVDELHPPASILHTHKKHTVEISRSLEVIQDDQGEKSTSRSRSCISRLRLNAAKLLDEFQTSVFDPRSEFLKHWELFVLTASVLNSFIVPYIASFSCGHDCGVHSIDGIILLVFSYVCDICFLMDIIIHLRTAVVTPYGMEVSFQSIKRHYVYSFNFIPDMLSWLPLELFCFLAPAGIDRWRLLSFLRFNRLLKFIKMIWYCDKLESGLDVSIGTLRLVKLTVYILIISHWCACMLFAAVCYGESCDINSWVTVHLGSATHQASTVKEYISSLYWASATMSSTGYGDIHAYTTVGRFVSLLSMLAGLLLYGYSLAAMAATLANDEAPKVGFQEKLFAVVQFMKENKLSLRLQQRVVSYYSVLWEKHRGVWFPGAEPLMHDMPVGLQQDVAIDDALATFGQVPLFQFTDEAFLRSLILKTTAYMFCPGDIIVYAGDMGREMYCIRRGECQIMTDDLKRSVATIGPGHYFGEIGLVFGDYRTATVQAKTHCEVLMLQRCDLDEVLSGFPLLQEQFENMEKNKNVLITLQKEAALRMNTKTTGKVQSFVDLAKREKKSGAQFRRKREVKNIEVQRFNSRLPNGRPDLEYLEPFKGLSPIPRLFSQLLMKRTFLPGSSLLKKWVSFRVVISVLAAMTVTVQAAFLHNFIPLWIINYLFDLTLFADVYISFHVAFYNSENVLVTHPVSTAANYLKKNFVLDFFSCFPFEVFVFAFSSEFSDDVMHLFAMLRINRLLQLYRLPIAFGYLESSVEKETGSIRLVKFGFYIIIFLHWLTCFQFIFVCPPYLATTETNITSTYFITSIGHKCYMNSWIGNIDGYEQMSQNIGEMYILSLYWASATAVSVGYGDISGHTMFEMVFSLSFMIMGVLFFGYIIASVAATLANADAQRARFQEKLGTIKKFMKDQKYLMPLQQRVIAYYEYVWIRTKGIDPDSLLDSLPYTLWTDVTLSLYQDLIGKVPLFKGTEQSFMKMLSRCIKPLLLLKGEYVIKKFDIGNEMFFIHRGAVDVVSEDGSMVFDTMKAGRFFGEVALLFSCPRTASIRAATNCDLFVLTKTDLDNVLLYYPAIKKQVMAIGEERRQQARKRSIAKIAPPPAAEPPAPADPPATATTSTPVVPITITQLGPDKALEREGARKPLEPLKKEGDSDEPSNTNPNASTIPSDSSDDPSNTNQSNNADDFEEVELSVIDIDMNTSNNSANLNNSNKAGPPPDAVPVGPRWRRAISRIREWNRFTIDPNDPICKFFAFVACILQVVTGWTIMYEAAFQDHHIAIVGVNYTCEAFFIFEIYLKLHLRFRDRFGDMVENFDRVYASYLKRWSGDFWLDLVAVFPLEVAALAAPPGKKMLVLSFLRLVRLRRLVRMSQYFAGWEKELNVNMLFVRLCKFAAILILLIHYMASMWFMIACPLGECQEGSWASLEDATTTMEHYCNSVYWTVATMTSTGYGDIYAHKPLEMFFAMIVMVVGKLMFGFILGNISSTLANAELQRVQYDEKLKAVKGHMLDQNVPQMLMTRVLTYFEFLWAQNKGVDVQALFRDTPMTLLSEISLALSRKMFESIELFAEADESCLRQLAIKVHHNLFVPQEFIIRKGDMGCEVYFVHRGEVEIVSEESGRIIEVHGPGQVLGEMGLIYDVTRKVSVRARTHVEVLVLNQPEMDEVLDQMPEIKKKIYDAAKKKYGHLQATLNTHH